MKTKMIRIYRSLDDGALYGSVDDPTDAEHWEAYDIPAVMTLKAKHLFTGSNDLIQVLLEANLAKKV